MAINVQDDNIMKRNLRVLSDEAKREDYSVKIEYNTEGRPKKQAPELDYQSPIGEPPRQGTEVAPNGINSTMQYTEKYTTEDYSSKALSKSQLQNADLVSVTRQQAENRISKREDELGIFLYNILPYEATAQLTELNNVAQDSPEASQLVTTAMTSLDKLQKLKYVTPAELTMILGSNFYSLHFIRGVTLKKGKNGALGITGPARTSDVYTGEIDLYYGREAKNPLRAGDLAAGIQKLFNAVGGIKVDSGNDKIAQLKDGENTGISPRITITPYYIDEKKKQSPYDQLSESNPMRTTLRTEILDTIVRDQIALNGRWQGTTDASDLETSSYSNIVSENRTKTNNVNEYLINPNVLNITQRILNSTNGSWIGTIDNSEIDTENFDYNKVKNRKPSTTTRDYLVNPDVIQVNLQLGNDPNNEINGAPEDLLRNKGFVKNQGKWQIGAVYVIPIVAAQYRQSLPRFFIPFEFNPEISEGGVEARYQATQILSRIGDLQSYTGTGSLTVSLSTNYYAVSHDESLMDSNGQGWMTQFTLERIQAIEMGFRSLVNPHFPEDQSIDQGYKYMKPPLIKILMGNVEDSSTPYANLLTYQNNNVVDGKLQTAEQYGGKLLRNFIATSVTIEKNLNETPIYLDEYGTIRDTFGFKVSMNLVEITPNYMDIPPDYKSYFDQYARVAPNYVERVREYTG